eukprot:NODE_1129_length_1878_cov_112.068946_g1070_i0.p1 GENE.NODE_1129_length_1878_cov_112.068946_g1070_i0~~NODE_1129_length_1878_cov_112.068946_g1070_i0.p1  ORF type:complete len:595 (+),score=142.53 NODE_1129_length_1878_cov_112.068946_g1070_i0:63-1847(+)
MPTLAVKRDVLFRLLGKEFTEEAFDELCFQFGVELDEVTSERIMAQKELKNAKKADLEKFSAEEIYKIDLPANRYDLLSVEGFVTALRVFQGEIPPPDYKLSSTMHEMVVGESVGQRPFVVCAALRGIEFTPERYASFIDIQEKLHQNLARKRTLVSVGTHDMDTIKGPFTYNALPRKDIKFVPLKQEVEITGEDFIEFYKKDLQLCKYLHMIEDKPAFPLIQDSNGVVMSLPPIINSRHSAINLNTKNVFLECTAVDECKANVMLNQLVCAFSLYCTDKFTVEPVKVKYADGREVITPNLSVREMECSVDWINRSIGIKQSASVVATALTKMMLQADAKDESTIVVRVPPTRSDILHQCDVMEDVAIAYGYDNIVKMAPSTLSVGSQAPISKLSYMVRTEMAHAGYNEALTLSLTSLDECFTWMRKPVTNDVVTIANPQTKEFQMVRNSLLPGLLKTLFASRANALPIKLFEVSDIVLKDATTDVGTKNVRHAAAVYCSTTSGFELTHGFLDTMMLMLGVKPRGLPKPDDNPDGYYIKPSNDPSFFEGRQAEFFWRGEKVGIREISPPEVLGKYQPPSPASGLEINISKFLKI